ncbi:Hypothetical protein, putative [Bodo saltans]|uniref:Uncharacterized protein n=1 Tax=Bodo saltans TaxID=75058 RepID=A0A0S4IUJ0_BODSA|nr:Hypothetical protein, putative [Bodo saltans]|eukprot:CUE92043.1 Hypothetical protein, putative [Bodo saltans]
MKCNVRTLKTGKLSSPHSLNNTSPDGGVLASVASSAGGAAGGFLSALLSGFAIAAVGSGEWLAAFYTSGAFSLVHSSSSGAAAASDAAATNSKKKANKLRFTKVYTMDPFRVPSALRGSSSSSTNALSTLLRHHHHPMLSSGPQFLPTPRWSHVHVYWTTSGFRTICRHTGAPLAFKELDTTCAVLLRIPITKMKKANSDATTTTTESSFTSSMHSSSEHITALAVFDTAIHGIVLLDVDHDFSVVGTLPIDVGVLVSLLAVPLVVSSGDAAAAANSCGGVTLFGVAHTERRGSSQRQQQQPPSGVVGNNNDGSSDSVVRVDVEVLCGGDTAPTADHFNACMVSTMQKLTLPQSGEDRNYDDDEEKNATQGEERMHYSYLRLALMSSRPPRRPQATLQQPPSTAGTNSEQQQQGQPSSSSSSGLLQLVTTESGAHVCAVVGQWCWNVRTGAVLHLPLVPLSSTPIPMVSSGEQIFMIGQHLEGQKGGHSLCIIDPTNPTELRSFVFSIPSFTSSPSSSDTIAGLQVDDNTKYASIINESKDEIVTINLREKCREVDRVCSRGTGGGGGGGSAAGNIFHAFTLRGGCCSNGQPYLVVVSGDEGGTSAATVSFLTISTAAPRAAPTATRKAPAAAGYQASSAMPAVTAAATRRAQETPAAPVAATKHRDPTTTVAVPTDNGVAPRARPANNAEAQRRAQSCGAEARQRPTPSSNAAAANAALNNTALNDKFNALQAVLAQNTPGLGVGATSAAGVRRRGASPPQPSPDPTTLHKPQDPPKSVNAKQQQHHADPNANPVAPSPPPPAPTPSSLLQPSAHLIGNRRADPFRQSGLLLTPQVLENNRTGDVVLRLGMRWSDMTQQQPGGGAAASKPFEIPLIRSHNSSICNTSSVMDQSLEGAGILHAAAVAAAAATETAKRPAVESALATELLLRRMHQRDAAVAEVAKGVTLPSGSSSSTKSTPTTDARKLEPQAAAASPTSTHAATGRYATMMLDSEDFEQHAKTTSVVKAAANNQHVHRNLHQQPDDDEIDMDIARKMLAHEREKLNANNYIGETPTSIASKPTPAPAIAEVPAAAAGPTPSNKSPVRQDEVQVAPITSSDPDSPSHLEEDDFVVCGSIVGWPPSVAAAAHSNNTSPKQQPLLTHGEPTFSKLSPQKQQAYVPGSDDDDDDDDDEHEAQHYRRGEASNNHTNRQSTADPSDFSKDSFDAELFGEHFRSTPPPRVAFAASSSVLSSSPNHPLPSATSPQAPAHHTSLFPLETLRPSDSRPVASVSSAAALRAQHRLDEIRRAAETVRRSIAALRDVILDDAAEGSNVTEGSTLLSTATDAECSASATEWNLVLTDVVSAMLATSTQRASSSSRPSSASSALHVKSYLAANDQRPKTAGQGDRGQRLTDAPTTSNNNNSVLLSLATTNTLDLLNTSGAGGHQSAVASAASAAQFQLLWSEMQRMQSQNAELLAAVISQQQATKK